MGHCAPTRFGGVTLEPKIQLGIALSGGTLKASAHVGVLTALEELGIRADCVAGTSAGSFVATLYAHGFTAADFQKLLHEFPGPTLLLDYGFPLTSSCFNYIRSWGFSNGQQAPLKTLPHGVFTGKRLRSYFDDALRGRTAQLPFYIVATDLLTGKPVIFCNDEASIARGMANSIADVASALVGSCAIPGIFTPVQVGDWILVDGAFRHYVPVHILRRIGCNRIIAINLYRLQENWNPKTFVHVFSRAYDILLQESIDDDIAGEDLLVLEPNVSDVSWTSFGKLRACSEKGRSVVIHNHAVIKRFVASGYPPSGPIQRTPGRLATPTNVPAVPCVRIVGSSAPPLKCKQKPPSNGGSSTP